MPEFSYEALASTGQRNFGTLVANSEREVVAMLDTRGLYAVRVAPAKASTLARSSGRRIRSRYTATLFSQLADLLHSGVPLLRSLDILERQGTQPALSAVVREIRADVADGTALADAMAKHPRAFNELAVSMVRAGQEGGFLEDVLHRIASFTEHQEDLKAKVIGALAYPIFLATVGFIVLNVLVIFFVPSFEPMFQKLEEQGELPALTVALVGTSHFLQRQGWMLLIAAAVGVFMVRRWMATPAGRLRVDDWRLRLPMIGHIYLSFALSRFTRILGTLLHNGIPILQSLRIAKDSTGNKVLAQAIEQSAQNVTAGDSLATPFAACRYLPRDVVEMVSVGEESNNLETVLLNISDSLDKRTGRQLELFVRLLEPVMLLIMASVALLVVAGLLLPVFKIGSAISQ